MRKKSNIILIGIVILAAFLRFSFLNVNPPSLTWDEVAWGYNGYSLGIDGKDEFGKILPITYLESFGDFKPPVYAYLDIVPVKIFGLNEFAVRFPSAFFGTLTVLLTYFLVKVIFRRISEKKHSANEYVTHEILALLSAFVLAVSPWHIMLSRAAFEANVATFFIVSGVTAFLYWIQERKLFLIAASIFFVLSLYTFNSARVVSPLLVFTLLIGFWSTVWTRRKDVLIAGIIGIIMLTPLIPFLVSPQAGLRYKEVNIFSDPSIVQDSNQSIANDNNANWSKVLHNRRVLYVSAYVHHYLDEFNPDFLFISGDVNPKFSTQDVGQLYLLSMPFLILGAFQLFKRREGSWWIIPLWLLLGIVPAAVARETPHALRTEATLPTFQILEAYGFVYSFIFLKEYLNKKRFTVVYTFIGMLYLLNIVYFIHGYYGHYAWQYSGEWQYGYKDSIAYVKEHENQFDKVVITDVLGRPYIYYLFYMHISPDFFRNHVKIERDSFGFVNIKSFGKYTFSNNISSIKQTGEKILYINDTKNLPRNAQVLKTFQLLNGEPVLAAYILR